MGLFLKAMERNEQYLLSLDLDRQLHVFRVTAGLPSSAAPLGGWESPDHMGRGEFFGHSLSARALLYAATGDARWKRQLDYLVAELANVSGPWDPAVILHAEPESVFDRLEAGEDVQGIYYTVHKLMAGLAGRLQLLRERTGTEIAEKMADWVDARSQPAFARALAKVLDVEFGGLNEALYNLYAITHNPRHLEFARRFDHEKIYRPLAEGRDTLKGLHANTTIPKIVGAARAYEVTGDSRFRKIAEYFWRQVAEHRSYATGGTSNDEHWRTAPDKLAGELSNETQECCCTYNMLKLTRHVFTWTGDPRAADFYERALFNGILGTLNPESGTTMYLRAVGRRLLEDVRFAVGFVLVLHRHRRGIVRQAGRQHLFPRSRILVGESVHRLGTELAGKGPNPQTGNPFSRATRDRVALRRPAARRTDAPGSDPSWATRGVDAEAERFAA